MQQATKLAGWSTGALALGVLGAAVLLAVTESIAESTKYAYERINNGQIIPERDGADGSPTT